MFELVKKIKEKKELSGLADEFVENVLSSYLKRNNVILPIDKKSEKIIVKEVRAELRNYAGRFQTSQKLNKRADLLENKSFTELLKTHSSTKERLDFYPTLKEKIKKLAPKSILDLGCGINPIALAPAFPKAKYYAYDIKEDELTLINKFFKSTSIKGEAFYCDLRKNTSFPKTDLCLIFKVLDIIESNSHKLAEKILTSLKCKNLIVSFSTRKLSGKKMNSPKRTWFEILLEKHSLEYNTLESDNEIFYFVKQ